MIINKPSKSSWRAPPSTGWWLVYISTTKRLVSLAWVAVVAAGFGLAFWMINNALLDWKRNPVVSTIETKKIHDVRFPKELIMTLTELMREFLSTLAIIDHILQSMLMPDP